MHSLELWFHQHPIAFGMLSTMVMWLLSAVTNWGLRIQTPLGWEQLKLKRPRLAALISFSRALGIDPVKLGRSILTLIRGKWHFPPCETPEQCIQPANEDKPIVIEVEP